MQSVHTLITTPAVLREESRASKAPCALAAPVSGHVSGLRLIGSGCDRFLVEPSELEVSSIPKNSKEFKGP